VAVSLPFRTAPSEGIWGRLQSSSLGVAMLGLIMAAGFWGFIWWIILVILWAVFIYFTYMLAASKGRSPLLWVILAIFFPLITIIILLILKPKPVQPV
jgi:hypothetical protein